MENNLNIWFTSPQKKIRPRDYYPFGKKESYRNLSPFGTVW